MTTAPTPIPRGHAPHRLYVVLLAALLVLLGTGVVLLGHDRSSSSSTNGR